MTYRSKNGTPDGLTGLALKEGAAGKAKAAAKGKGALLSSRPAGLPALPLPLPLRVQLEGPNGACVEALYDVPGVIRNDPATGRFKARATQ